MAEVNWLLVSGILVGAVFATYVCFRIMMKLLIMVMNRPRN